MEEHGEVNLAPRLEKLERFHQLWWQRWMDAGFSLLTPRLKWSKEKRNLAVGDVVLLKHDKKLGAADFRLAKVLEVMPDQDGMVRSVVIGMRRRRGAAREAATVCKQGLDTMVMGIQRLVVIQPVEEQWSEGVSTN